MSPYSFAVEQAVLDSFASASPRHQRILLDGFTRIAAQPFREPDWIEHDAANRALSVVLHEDWLVSYWTDHAARKVMFAEVERVEGP